MLQPRLAAWAATKTTANNHLPRQFRYVRELEINVASAVKGNDPSGWSHPAALIDRFERSAIQEQVDSLLFGIEFSVTTGSSGSGATIQSTTLAGGSMCDS